MRPLLTHTLLWVPSPVPTGGGKEYGPQFLLSILHFGSSAHTPPDIALGTKYPFIPPPVAGTSWKP